MPDDRSTLHLSTSAEDDGAWDDLLATLGGRSTIDAPRLSVGTVAQAAAYLECYGFRWSSESDRKLVERLRRSAIKLIEQELLAADERVLPAVRRQRDVPQLMLWASERSGEPRALWSCSLLRGMHALAHCQRHFNDRYGAEIREQIFGRFSPHLQMHESGQLTLGRGADAIELSNFDLRPTKELHSVALKLLHKSENVAVDVFDWVGLRFVTKERFDTLLVIKYLRENHVINFANAKPTRTKNNLIDLQWLREEVGELDRRLAAGELDQARRLELLRRRVRQRPYPSASTPFSENPFSAMGYHAIQLTCRQMIRIRARSGPGRALREGIRFFFPFEIQLLDEESYWESVKGHAAHDQYKLRQREAVRQRVLGLLLDNDGRARAAGKTRRSRSR